MSFRLWICDSLHLLSHALAPNRWECVCYQTGFMRALKRRRDAELRELSTPRSPEELEKQLRLEQWIRENAT